MPKYYIKYVSPKISKSTGKTDGYTIMVENDKGNYNYSDYFSAEDMKTLYGCNTENDCLNLKGKAVELQTTIKIIK